MDLPTFPTTPDEIAIAESLYLDSPVEIDKIIPEVVHRYFAASLGLPAIALVFIAFKERKMKSESLALLLIIIGQGIFGYLTVSLKLHPLIVTSHLFGAMIVTSLFLVIFMKSLRVTNSYLILVRNRPYIIIGFVNHFFRYSLGPGLRRIMQQELV